MANKINFISGETYTLAELFSGNRRIIIPDLQRDYCWGNENNKKGSGETGELVSDFIKNLFEQYENKNVGYLNLGLFYGYEVPANHIQLCDGQQRLTTLYLLLGMIHKATGKFRQNLISDFEYKHDDHEPYLNYAIRESSLYFLSDLVYYFFIERSQDKVNEIYIADWYFTDYELDSSIQSMLKALTKIEDLLINKDKLWLETFGDWVLNKLTFLYFDMENRSKGEETFVVINTTGESLSVAQNLKPLVLSEKNDLFDNTSFRVKIDDKEINISQCWEQIETWFWLHRIEANENDTADAGFEEFLRWITIIEQAQLELPIEEQTDVLKYLGQVVLQGKHKEKFPYKTISFQKIYDYWQALRCLLSMNVCNLETDYLSPKVNKDVNNRKALNQTDCFVLLPTLFFVYKNYLPIIEGNETLLRNARRVYEFFKNLIRIDNVSKAVNPMVCEAIRIIDLIDDGDIISLLHTKQHISSTIYSHEEKLKLKIFSNSENRNEIEEAFWKAQQHNIWSGEILPMIEWSTTNEGNFDFLKFKEYHNKFDEIFYGQCNSNIDDVRRALLTLGLNGYPRIFSGYVNYSFGWEWSDWKKLIKDNIDNFKNFFDELISGKTIQQIIDNYDQESNMFFRFVKNPQLMAYAKKKNIQKQYHTYRIIKSIMATRFIELETYCLYLEYVPNSIEITLPTHINYKGWDMWLYDSDSSALAFEKVWDNIKVTVDVHFYGRNEKDWDIQLFIKKVNITTIQNKLLPIAENFDMLWNWQRYELKEMTKREVKIKLEELFEFIK